ncbi:proline--tRNA ligase [Collinsella tanakaei]|uniref:proline--tRNA ligase n=1 Tax=Collinsella tanakaei TaxID=626935 RepID=UPI001F4298E1|nr:proline--tRNA ligase [Collinsella tanakaei]MCF2620827.1 proline--tRNA ligase [Collinsella tanakaei]
MKMSNLYAPTLKEDPAEAELASHRLLLRAGMIRKVAAGLYSYLPLAWRSIRKIEAICRDEMDAIGAQEMMAPILTPAELWEESGRIGAYGPELMRLEDRHDRTFCLGPTHEETFTDLVRNELRSYKQLPLTLYHIQDKFRDELRPRFGLMRSREFIMKDAYSFSATQESLQEVYEDMKGAYARYCERCGLKALPVAADSGEIGGDSSIEYMALAEAGEASLVWCDCGFAADDEAASTTVVVSEGPGDGTLEKVHTPGLGTIEAVAAFFGFPENGTRKSLALIDGDGEPVVAIVPGDHELNDIKTSKLFGDYHLMSDEELEQFGLHKGFIGPVGLPAGIRLVCDESLKSSTRWACGANEVDYHYTGACPDRDFAVDMWADLVTVKPGDPCPHCGKILHGGRGIECGQVFQIGTEKYAAKMGATFADENGREQPFYMGCYGIGISRTLAAIVEQHHDDGGIVWPVSVAPYEVSVIALDKKGEAFDAAADLADQLAAAGIDVVFDDRKERPGVKFADNDLMGFPYQLIVGKRGLQNGTVELKVRADGTREDLVLDGAVAELVARVERERR